MGGRRLNRLSAPVEGSRSVESRVRLRVLGFLIMN
jgi:hypothetical protein